MESRETCFAWLDQTRVRSSLKPTIPKPFRLRTKERSDLRASNAEKRAKQVKGKADSLKIEKLRNSSEAVGSHLEKESNASVSMDVIASATRVTELESETGQALPNQKTTVLRSDISISSGCEPVAAGANPCSAATPVTVDSQRRTSFDLLNFISLKSFRGISLTEEGPGDFEFIMDSAINYSFDGSHVPEAWNCVTPTGIIIDGGPNRTPTSSNEGEIWPKEGTGLSTNGVTNSSPMSLPLNAKSAAPAKDDSVLKSDGATLLPIDLNSMKTSDEVIRSMVLDEGNESREGEDLGYWENPYNGSVF